MYKLYQTLIFVG